MTPSTVDIFSRTMAEAFDDNAFITIAKGFQAFFGRPENGGETIFSPDANVVDIDIQRGNKKIAALIPRGTVSRSLGSLQKNQEVDNYTTFSRKYPLAEEEGDINAGQLNNRIAGENPYDRMTRLDRMRILAAKQVRNNIRRIGDLFEVLAAQSILTGEMDAILGTSNSDLKYDFHRSASHIVTVANAWNSGSQTIFDDIDSACEKIERNGRAKPDFIGIGGDAMNAFLADTDVKDKADNRRFELIKIRMGESVPAQYQRFVNAGWNARGKLQTPGGRSLWVFTYTQYYENSAGTAVDLLPKDNAIVAATSARCDRYFGPPETLPLDTAARQFYNDNFGFDMNTPPMPMNTTEGGIIVPEMFYHDAYPSNDRKKVSVRTQAAPIFATTMTDAFVTLKGLVA